VLARATLAGLLIAGSVYAYLVSLPWPEHPAPPPAAPSAPSPQAMLGYGVRLGAAAAALPRSASLSTSTMLAGLAPRCCS